MGRLGASALLLASLIAAASAIDTASAPQRLAAGPLGDGDAWNASVTVSMADRKPISPLLFGIFFEEASGATLPLPARRRCRRCSSAVVAPLPARFHVPLVRP